MHNGNMSYVGADHGWFIWWDGGTDWLISQIKGTPGATKWVRIDASPWGAYNPIHGGGGVATFAVP